MPAIFDTPQDAEDAYYDAIDEQDFDAMMAVWDTSDQVACLLPMQPLVQGRIPVAQAWKPMLGGEFQLDIEVLHIQWVQLGDVAIHYLQEKAKIPGQGPAQPPVYATNIYRKVDGGWRMVLHQNSPAPPPPGMLPPGGPELRMRD